METAHLKAETRTAKGTRASFNFRREGRLPGVIYGEGDAPEMVLISQREFEAALRHHVRVLELDIGSRHEKVLIQDLQWNDLGDRINHVDFLRLSKDAIVEIEVEIDFVGHPKGLSKGGEFVKGLSDLKIRCRPEAIPEKVTVMVNDLDIEDAIHISDLELPEGVEALHEAEEVVCVVHQRAEETEEPAEGEEGEGSAEPEVITKGKGEDDEPSEG